MRTPHTLFVQFKKAGGLGNVPAITIYSQQLIKIPCLISGELRPLERGELFESSRLETWAFLSKEERNKVLASFRANTNAVKPYFAYFNVSQDIHSRDNPLNSFQTSAFWDITYETNTVDVFGWKLRASTRYPGF